MGTSSDARGDVQPAGASRPAAQTPGRKRLGKYELLRTLGAGGMGTVYLAKDTQLNRTVALKILPKDKTSNPTLVKRFKAEAKSAAQLKHDNIVSVFEADQIEGCLYISLEYVDGTDVQFLVEKRGVLPVKRSVEIVRQVARALQHAHSKGIVHRDIKPSNLLVDRDGNVKLTDMGLARSIDDTLEASITRAGTTVGTVDYMAPEQARDSKLADVRSDIYSLGCTWYHMLTGMPPFPEGSLTNKLYSHVTKSRPDPREKNEAIPETVVLIMHRMMAKRPKDRYQTPEELLEDLENTDTHPTATLNLIFSAVDDVALPDDTVVAAARTTSRPVLPPRIDRNERKSDRHGQRSYLEVIKYLLVVIAVVAFVVFAWWAITGWMSRRSATDNKLQDNPYSRKTDSADKRKSQAGPLIADQSGPKTKAKASSGRRDARALKSNNKGPQDDTASGLVNRADKKNLAPKTEGVGAHLPRWAQTAAEGNEDNPFSQIGLPVRTVGRRSDGGTSRYSSWNASLSGALNNTTATGAAIVLVGDGPFILPQMELSRRRRIVITAASESRPVILFAPDPNEPTDVVFRVMNGSLALSGVHLIVPEHQFPDEGELKLIEVFAGDLALRGCTVTFEGTRRGGTTALSVTGGGEWYGRTPLSQARLFVDKTVVRGDGLSAFAIDRGAIDFVARDSLFATGGAPVLRLTRGFQIENLPKQGDTPPRKLTISRCTSICRKTAFDFDPGNDATNPPATQVVTAGSLFAAEEDPATQDPTLLVLRGWPLQSSRGANKVLPKDLRWDARSSLFLGWKNLVRVPSDASRTISDPTLWSQFAATSINPALLHASRWPEQQIENLSRLKPRQLELAAPIVTNAQTNGDAPLGCDVTAFTLPRESYLKRAAAVAARPVPPPALQGAERPANEVQLDLARVKGDLGTFVSNAKWEDGTEFVVSGSGEYRSEPIRVQGKSLRIRFLQTGPKPLWILPNPIDLDRKLGADGAFISVKDGALRIDAGRFRIRAHSRRSSAVRYFLHVENGSFSLNRTHVEGPMSDSRNFLGLIRWKSASEASLGTDRAGWYNHYGSITNSYLRVGNVCLEATLGGQGLTIQNSLLVGVQRLFEFDFDGSAQPISAAVNIANCTLSAGESFFRVRAAAPQHSFTNPIQLFVEKTVFAPPVMTARHPNQRPTLVAFVGTDDQRREQLVWWGMANGYTSKIASFLSCQRSPQDRGVPTPASSWKDAWGPAQVLRPLTGEGVVLAGNPNRLVVGEYRIGNFGLDTKSKAFRWGATTRKPIGADIASLEISKPIIKRPSKPKSRRSRQRTKRSNSKPKF